MENQGVPLSQLMPVAGGEPVRLSDDVTVTCTRRCTRASGRTPVRCSPPIRCASATSACPTRSGSRGSADLTRVMAATLDAAALGHFTAGDQDVRGDGGALVFLVETPDGTVLYQDTSGHWSGILHDLRPDVAILAAAGRGNVDGEPVQGTLAEFVARQAGLVHPRPSCCPTTTTGCRASRPRSTLTRWPTRLPATRRTCDSPGSTTSTATACSGAEAPNRPCARIGAGRKWCGARSVGGTDR